MMTATRTFQLELSFGRAAAMPGDGFEAGAPEFAIGPAGQAAIDLVLAHPPAGYDFLLGDDDVEPGDDGRVTARLAAGQTLRLVHGGMRMHAVSARLERLTAGGAILVFEELQ